MDHKITLKIAGRTFSITVNSPDQEEVYRRAAESINARFSSYTQNYPGKTADEILSMVALSEASVRFGYQKEIERYRLESDMLAKDLQLYLGQQK